MAGCASSVSSKASATNKQTNKKQKRRKVGGAHDTSYFILGINRPYSVSSSRTSWDVGPLQYLFGAALKPKTKHELPTVLPRQPHGSNGSCIATERNRSALALPLFRARVLCCWSGVTDICVRRTRLTLQCACTPVGAYAP